MSPTEEQLWVSCSSVGLMNKHQPTRTVGLELWSTKVLLLCDLTPEVFAPAVCLCSEK